MKILVTCYDSSLEFTEIFEFDIHISSNENITTGQIYKYIFNQLFPHQEQSIQLYLYYIPHWRWQYLYLMPLDLLHPSQHFIHQNQTRKFSVKMSEFDIPFNRHFGTNGLPIVVISKSSVEKENWINTKDCCEKYPNLPDSFLHTALKKNTSNFFDAQSLLPQNPFYALDNKHDNKQPKWVNLNLVAEEESLKTAGKFLEEEFQPIGSHLHLIRHDKFADQLKQFLYPLIDLSSYDNKLKNIIRWKLTALKQEIYNWEREFSKIKSKMQSMLTMICNCREIEYLEEPSHDMPNNTIWGNQFKSVKEILCNLQIPCTDDMIFPFINPNKRNEDVVINILKNFDLSRKNLEEEIGSKIKKHPDVQAYLKKLSNESKITIFQQLQHKCIQEFIVVNHRSGGLAKNSIELDSAIASLLAIANKLIDKYEIPLTIGDINEIKRFIPSIHIINPTNENKIHLENFKLNVSKRKYERKLLIALQRLINQHPLIVDHCKTLNESNQSLLQILIEKFSLGIAHYFKDKWDAEVSKELRHYIRSHNDSDLKISQKLCHCIATRVLFLAGYLKLVTNVEFQRDIIDMLHFNEDAINVQENTFMSNIETEENTHIVMGKVDDYLSRSAFNPQDNKVSEPLYVTSAYSPMFSYYNPILQSKEKEYPTKTNIYTQ